MTLRELYRAIDWSEVDEAGDSVRRAPDIDVSDVRLERLHLAIRSLEGAEDTLAYWLCLPKCIRDQIRTIYAQENLVEE